MARPGAARPGAVTILTNDTHWGPAPRPVGHGPREPAALAAALPLIGFPKAPAPLPSTSGFGQAMFVLEGENRPPAVAALAMSEAGAGVAPRQRDGAGYGTLTGDVLFGALQDGWFADSPGANATRLATHRT